MELNSKDYWDHRFDTDWEEYGGSKQTRFFAKVALKMMPEWLIREIRLNQYKICDMGCALGDAVDELSKQLEDENICGLDFSEEAIKIAQKRYPEYSFYVGDLNKGIEDTSVDVVFCSNVLEHMEKPKKILENFSGIAKKYIIILIPFKEEYKIEEHITKFYENNIPVNIGDFHLIYTDSVDASKIPDSYYPDQQILLVYSCDKNNISLTKLEDTVKGSNKSFLKKYVSKEENEILKTEKAAAERLLQERTEQFDSVKTCLEEVNEGLKLELDDIKISRDTILQKNEELSGQLNTITGCYQEEQKNREEIQAEHERLLEIKNSLEEQVNALKEELDQMLPLKEENISLKDSLDNALFVAEQKDLIIQRALQQCDKMLGAKLFKVTHLMNRTLNQGIRGSKEERKLFRKWVFTHHKTGGDRDRRYNPLWPLIDILKSPIPESIGCLNKSSEDRGVIENNKSQEVIIENVVKGNVYIDKDRMDILSKEYTAYDVIILSVIDYDFRYQRPQHFADRYAANGHRVFYINANHYNPDSVTQLKENLYIVNIFNPQYNAIHLTDWGEQQKELQQHLRNLMDTYCIRDAVTIVDYPNWFLAAKYLKEMYGFKVITDYMDDYTGFLNPAEKLVGENCKKLLKYSDEIIPSSQFLYDIAKEYNPDISIVRNGTEFAHFHQAYGKNTKKQRAIIGYYGAIAEWFDVEKVCYLAKKMPQCDIVLIGNITAGEKKLRKYENIKLLGEKPYKELPEYLKDFDVCLIPFDTSTDLIKATNPVKFYEYLSAGKKVVSTEIPELAPFKDKYVYMANDNDKFMEYVQMCLEGRDTLANEEECIHFAKENDWQQRYEVFASLVEKAVPQIDILVLTYNNLKLNKVCINSILQKTAYPNYRLIIVDNLSTDGTREYLKQLDAQHLNNVTIILNDSNLGFAGGNNVGMRISDGDYIVLLNNDTVVTRGWLTAMSKHLENNPRMGMCGPVTNSIGNEAKINVKYNDLKELECFAYDYTTKHLSEEYFKEPRVLALFCTMIKKEIIKKCGLLDESYEVGMFEDDDYAEAVKQAGYSLAILEDTFIHHCEGASFKKLQDEKYKAVFEHNKQVFEEKWNKEWLMHQYREGVTWDSNLNVNIL